MKRIFYILLLFYISINLTACKTHTANPILFRSNSEKNADIDDGDNISFSIDKVSLSKSYQNIEPSVQIVKKGLSNKLLASFGLVQSSGIKIEKINKTGNNIDIYVSNKTMFKTDKLVVPKVLIDIEEESIKNLEEFKYNIYNMNFEPIKIKLDANDAINRINSDYKISTSSLPKINISKNMKSYYWTLEYSNIFSRSFKDSPIIDLTVEVDADTGKIINSKEEPVSSFIDNGLLMDFAQGKYILYRKFEPSSNENPSQTLWIYNIESKSKEKIFTSNDSIISATFSQDHTTIALLESRDKNNQIYLIPLADSKAYKVDLKTSLKPSIIKWQDNNRIYIVHKDKSSSISSYNIKEDQLELLAQSDKNILDFDIFEDYFLVLEEDLNGENSKICLSKDLEDSIYNTVATDGKFIDEDRIAYIRHNSKNDRHDLVIYDIKAKEVLKTLDYDISSFTVLSKDTLTLVGKNRDNRDFTLYEFNLQEDTITAITNISSDKISLNLHEDLLYINSTLPFDELETEIIYTVGM